MLQLCTLAFSFFLPALAQGLIDSQKKAPRALLGIPGSSEMIDGKQVDR
jgi:hypothetical protein